MRTVMGILFLLWVVDPSEAEVSEEIVQRAFRLEQSAFAETYVQVAFDQWLKTTGARLTEAVEIHMTKRRGRTEIQVEGLDVSDRRGLPAANPYSLIFELKESGQIADVRRLLIRERAGWSGADEAVAQFVEHFVWVYDTGSAALLRDFLYPTYITLRYSGYSTTEESIGQLRKDFSVPLPIDSVSWERSEDRAEVTLSPAPEPHARVILTVDIPRYIAARGPKPYEKVEALRDSLKRWSERRPIRDPRSLQERRTVKISSEKEVVLALQEDVFRGYKVVLLDSTRYVIEASLPPFQGLIPAILRYRLRVVRIDTLAVEVQPLIESSVQVGDSMVWWHEEEALPKPDISIADSVLGALLQEHVYRYRSVSLPAVFRPPLHAASSFEARLIVHQKEDEGFTFHDPLVWNHVLGKLSENTLAYYVPRAIEASSLGDVGVANSSPNSLDSLYYTPQGIQITGYAVWKKRSEAWHHFAKVREVYALREDDGSPRVARVWVDLYPFVRTDVLADLFAAPEEVKRGKQRFQIRIR